MSSAHPEPFSGECRNCGTAFSGHYCPGCGQGAHIEVPTAWEFLHEFFGHYIALEGKLLRTLKILFLSPGQLTLDYLEGRRQSRVLPLRLYLSCSVLFFLVLAIADHFDGGGWVHLGAADSAQAKKLTPEEQKQIDQAAAKGGLKIQLKANDEEGAEQTGAASSARRSHVKGEIDINGRKVDLEKVQERLTHYAPHGLFALLPCFAALLALFYRRRHQRYGAHLLFALHVHAFAFLWLIPAQLIPESASGGWLATLESIWYWGIPAYLVLALRRVYGGRWHAALLRVVALGACYGLIALLALLGGLVLAAVL